MADESSSSPPESRGVLEERGNTFVQLFERERTFLIVVSVLLITAGFVYPMPPIARWMGFALAAYSAVANDSIQTLGTFLASNRDKPWWSLWLFIGGLFVLTVSFSWWAYDGDVSYERLDSKGFDTTPASFTYLQVAAPIVLMILTRLRIPVSTTFLLLSCFATDIQGIGGVIRKSLMGYVVAFVVAIVVWIAVARLIERRVQAKRHHPGWRVFQWCTTGLLWSVWVQQDAANVAVYLPRSLSLVELAAFAGVIFGGLGLLFRFGGERIQRVVDDKSHISDVRAAAAVDCVYAAILYVFKIHSKIPMSTTWVFVGLLAGRELAMTIRGTGEGWREASKLVFADLWRVAVGFVVSLALALAVNEAFRQQLLGF